MELPDQYFPSNPCPYKMHKSSTKNDSWRVTFAEYGAHQNVNIDIDEETGNTQFWPQKGQKGVAGLSSVLPIIPLCNKPIENKWITRDRILGVSNFKETVVKMKAVVTALPFIKGKIRKFPEAEASQNIDLCIKAVKKMEKSKKTFDHSMTVLRSKLPSSVHLVCEKLQDIGQAYNSNCLNGYNRDFYGGLLEHSGTENDSTETLVHVKGASFNEICVSNVSTDNKTGLKHLDTKSTLTMESVFQLCTSRTSTEKLLFCARQDSSCQLLSVENTERLCKEKQIDFNGLISSSCFSPYIGNEILVSSPTGSVHLWDINKGVRCLRSAPESNASSFLESWSSSYFGGHPRHIVVAETTSLKLFDHRSKFQAGVALFSLPNSLTKPEERVMAACHLGFPYHCVATDFGLFLLDSRFPRTPVLSWSTEMMSPPQYLQCLQPQKDTNDCRKLLFMASQQPAEVMCFPVDVVGNRPPTAPLMPWRTSRIHHLHSFSSLETSLKKRFEFSLAGLAVSPICPNGSFSVYQLDSCGDIFYQTYTPDAPASCLFVDDCTGPNRQAFEHFRASTRSQEKAAKARVESWFSALEAQSLAASAEIALLSPDPESGDSKSVSLDETLVSSVFSCSPSSTELLEQEQIAQTREKHVKSNRPHAHLRDFKGLIYKTSQTQLLLALRDGRDITEYLKIREEKHLRIRLKKRRQALREKKQQKHAEGQASKRRRIQSNEDNKQPEPHMSVLNRTSPPETDKEGHTRNCTPGNFSAKRSRIQAEEDPPGPTVSVSRQETNSARNNSSSPVASPTPPNAFTPVATIRRSSSRLSLKKLSTRGSVDNREKTENENRAEVEVLDNGNESFNDMQNVEVNQEPQPDSFCATSPVHQASTSFPYLDSQMSRKGTPSLFSSSSSSSSCSSVTRGSGVEENTLNSHNKESHGNRSDQPELLSYPDIISWLLNSGKKREAASAALPVQEPNSRQDSDTPGAAQAVPPSTRRLLNFSDIVTGVSGIETGGLTLSDVRASGDCPKKTPSDLTSICSSQRSATLAKPGMRRVVDPSLSGFLSTPERARMRVVKRGTPK